MNNAKWTTLVSCCLAAAASLSEQLPCGENAKPDWVHLNGSVQAGNAYQLYGARFNDEPYASYQASVDIDVPLLGTLGVGEWTMNDLTHRAWHKSRWNTETDLDVHLYRSFDMADSWTVNAYVGYVWFLFYHAKDEWDAQRSVIWGFDIDNTWVTPFVSFEYEHAYLPGMYAEGGLKRAFAVTETLSVTPSMSVAGMGKHFKESFFPQAEYSNGVSALYAKLRADWQVSSWATLFAQVTWCSLIDDDIRGAVDREHGTTYANDYAIAEAGLSFAF